MSLELCWTEQLGFSHCQGPQGTDIYRRGEQVKCYQYLGVLRVFAKEKKSTFFPPPYLLLYVGSIKVIAQFLRQKFYYCTS